MNRLKIMAVGAFTLAAFGALMMLSRAAEPEDHPTSQNTIRVIDVRNECAHSVWISYGRAAPLRREDALSVGSGTTSAEPMIEGDKVWLLDADRNVVDVATVAAATTAVVIGDECGEVRSIPV